MEQQAKDFFDQWLKSFDLKEALLDIYMRQECPFLYAISIPEKQWLSVK